jgi:hypothetical protein
VEEPAAAVQRFVEAWSDGVVSVGASAALPAPSTSALTRVPSTGSCRVGGGGVSYSKRWRRVGMLAAGAL